MRWMIVLALLSSPCLAEPATRESKVVMDLRAEVERLKKEVETLRAEIARLKGKPTPQAVANGMSVAQATRAMEADGWELRYESKMRQAWRKEEGDFHLHIDLYFEGGVVSEVNRSRTRR